ncbi:hypothetical protein BV25DRAFT_1829570 [Artomyces pyxidatus]|uniref:Uncharacterized protein n=1 Tax=Artomyces pyxidatus TaxID=48021 RepID=A0ACB8SSN5_9AGAM|nr:hypothetical protein BV25DRAFT_1829570 [Artomyces pyxidatus]
MSSCPVCLETLNQPTSLPCGHMFCFDCVQMSARASRSLSEMNCPTCRAPCPKVSVDLRIVPHHLRPFVFSPFRRVYLNGDVDTADVAPSASADDASRQHIARLQASNTDMVKECTVLRQRAHRLWTVLVARELAATEHARLIRKERDEMAQKYETSKRKIASLEQRRGGEHEKRDRGATPVDRHDEFAPLFTTPVGPKVGLTRSNEARPAKRQRLCPCPA